jgi:hypothetical protein
MHLGKKIFFSFYIKIILYNLSWQIYRLNRRRIKQQHAGQIFGFISCLARFPNDNACIIVLSNLEDALIDDLIDCLTNILFEEQNSSD